MLLLVAGLTVGTASPAHAWNPRWCGHGTQWSQGATAVYRESLSMYVEGRPRHWHRVTHYHPTPAWRFGRGEVHDYVIECPPHGTW